MGLEGVPQVTLWWKIRTGICAVSMADSEKDLEIRILREYPASNPVRERGSSGSLKAVFDYFETHWINLPVDVDGMEFRRKVWEAISAIPYGKMRPYNQIADSTGNSNSCRPAANACGSDQVPLLIPCHRAIRKDGSLAGYGLGKEKKRFLLEMEEELCRESPGD